MATPKHRAHTGATYFVTANTWQRRELFVRDAVASIMEQAILRYRDQGCFHLHRYVIMPDHLHLLLTLSSLISLARAVQFIKGGSAHDIGKHLGMRFPVWQPGYTEHQIRDQRDYERHVSYIDWNPVKARLVEKPQEHLFGSASGRHRMDSKPVASGAKALGDVTGLCGGAEAPPFGRLGEGLNHQ